MQWRAESGGIGLALTLCVSRTASPIIKAGLILAVLLLGAARVRARDLPSCSQEITRCLAACRAVCSRRLVDNERLAKFPVRGAAQWALGV